MVYGVQLGCRIFNLIKWNWILFDIVNADWDTPDLVCDDDFDTIDAESACYTLGYSNAGVFRTYYNTDWTKPDVPFLMDNVQCGSASTNFLSCSSSAENCDHHENVFLACYSSGKKGFAFKPWPFLIFVRTSCCVLQTYNHGSTRKLRQCFIQSKLVIFDNAAFITYKLKLMNHRLSNIFERYISGLTISAYFHQYFKHLEF